MVSRAIRGMSTYVEVEISPATTTWPVVTRVSQATRPYGSSRRTASRTPSEIWSAILSGCPSVTDSDVKRCCLMRWACLDRGDEQRRSLPAGPAAPGPPLRWACRLLDGREGLERRRAPAAAPGHDALQRPQVGERLRVALEGAGRVGQVHRLLDVDPEEPGHLVGHPAGEIGRAHV